MKIYHSLDTELTIQNCGSVWLGILRGPVEHNTLTFNGLWNLMATSGELESRNVADTVVTFWTSHESMRRFFMNQFFIPRTTGGKKAQGPLMNLAWAHATERLNALVETQERFIKFGRDNILPNEYSSGVISAERPDHDMKDEILKHAFAEKDTDSVVDKA